jgi:DNA-directed RNA polymerase specialized sigma24 family protein
LNTQHDNETSSQDSRRSFAALLERVRQGDAAAAEDFFARLADEGAEGGTLLAIARKLLGRDPFIRGFVESRDLVQSALRCGWLDLSQFRGETPAEFFGWMRSILRARLGRVARKKQPQSASSPQQYRTQ